MPAGLGGFLFDLSGGGTLRYCSRYEAAYDAPETGMSDTPDRPQSSSAPEEEVWIAISAFEQILEAMPNDRSSLEALSHAYEQIGDHTRAKDYLLRLARVVVNEGDWDAAEQVSRQLSPYAVEDVEVANAVRSIRERAPAAEEPAPPAGLEQLFGEQPVAEPRYESFNLADELSFAWSLLEDNHLTQEEYAALVQDLTDMASSEATTTVSVLHALEVRTFKGLERLLVAVSKSCATPIITLGHFDIQQAAVEALPLDFMVRRGALVFDFIGQEPLVVVMNPHDLKLRKAVQSLTGKTCHYFMTLPSDFDTAMTRMREISRKITAD